MRKSLRAFIRLSFIGLVVFLSANTLLAANVDNGKKLFEINCQACHKLGTVLVGPDLIGVKSRWKDEKLLHEFIHNSQAVIAKDAYAKTLFAKFNVVMPPQSLSEEEISDVVEYVNSGGGAAPATSTAGAPVTYQKVSSDHAILDWMFWAMILLLVVVLFLASKITKSLLADHKEVQTSNDGPKLNGYIFPVFMVAFFAFLFYDFYLHTTPKYILPEAASDTGREIDFLFLLTTIITAIVFVVTHIILFWFSYKYRYNPNRKAYFYSHNNTLELIWTAIPAVGLVLMVTYGFKTWTKATSAPEKTDELVELFAFQFGWEFRYPGPDGILGKTDFRLIDPAANPLGLDWKDPASADDFIVEELHLPAKKTVHLKLRSRDVLHAAFLMHFRAQMYCQPGMDTRIRFTPLYTTSEYRKMIDKPDFNYELACNQLCGVSHYNMRRVIVIDNTNDYQDWKSKQKTAMDRFNPKTASK